MHLSEQDQVELEELVSAIRSSMSAERWDVAYRTGRTSTVAEVIHEVEQAEASEIRSG